MQGSVGPRWAEKMPGGTTLSVYCVHVWFVFVRCHVECSTPTITTRASAVTGVSHLVRIPLPPDADAHPWDGRCDAHASAFTSPAI